MTDRSGHARRRNDLLPYSAQQPEPAATRAGRREKPKKYPVLVQTGGKSADLVLYADKAKQVHATLINDTAAERYAPSMTLHIKICGRQAAYFIANLRALPSDSPQKANGFSGKAKKAIG